MQKLLKAGGLYFIGILLGRIVGLARQIVIGAQLGKTSLADATILLIRIPDLVLTIMIAGAMAAALIPELKSLPEGEAWRLHKNSLRWVAIGMTGLAAILAAFSMPIVQTLGKSLPPDYVHAAALGLPLMLLAVPLSSLASVTASYLQTKGQFFVPSLMALVYNTGLVIGVLAMSGQKHWTVLGLWAAVAAAVSFGVQWITAQRYRPSEIPETGGKVSRELIVRYGQAFLAGVLFYMLPLVAIKFASATGAGGVTSLDYAIRLTELPLGTLLTVFAVVLFPTISEHFSTEEGHDRGMQLVRQGVGLVLICASVIAATMLFFASDYVQLLYAHGELRETAHTMVPACVAVMSGMVFQALVPMLQSVLNARKDTLSPFWCSLVALVAFGVAGGFLKSEISIAYGYAAAQAVVFVALCVALWVRHRVNILPSLTQPRMWLGVAVGVGLSLGLGWVGTLVTRSSTVHVLISLVGGLVGLGAALVLSPDQRALLRRQA